MAIAAFNIVFVHIKYTSNMAVRYVNNVTAPRVYEEEVNLPHKPLADTICTA